MEKTEEDIKGVCKDESGGVKPDEADRYQEVADEIAYVIKDDLLESTGFDATRIADVLRRRFDVKNEEKGRVLMSDVTMLRIHDGSTFEIPIFGMLAFPGPRTFPIIPEISFPNYDIRNKYMGYTYKGVFHRVNWWTEFIGDLKRNPSMILVGIIGIFMIIHTFFGLV